MGHHYEHRGSNRYGYSTRHDRPAERPIHGNRHDPYHDRDGSRDRDVRPRSPEPGRPEHKPTLPQKRPSELPKRGRSRSRSSSSGYSSRSSSYCSTCSSGSYFSCSTCSGYYTCSTCSGSGSRSRSRTRERTRSRSKPCEKSGVAARALGREEIERIEGKRAPERARDPRAKATLVPTELTRLHLEVRH